MVSCAEGKCKNNTKGKGPSFTSIWPGRKFLRFYAIPNRDKHKELFQKWRLRIQRKPEDITNNTRVCSEHFCDEDFNFYDLQNAARQESVAKLWIRLKPDAVPNTDRETGELKIYCSSQLGGGPLVKKPRRKRVRRDIGYIDELVKENEEIVGCKQILCESESSLPQTPMKQDTNPVPNLTHEKLPIEARHDKMRDRYQSAVISGDTENNKGVQCHPSSSNISTQAGLSTLIGSIGPLVNVLMDFISEDN